MRILVLRCKVIKKGGERATPTKMQPDQNRRYSLLCTKVQPNHERGGSATFLLRCKVINAHLYKRK